MVGDLNEKKKATVKLAVQDEDDAVVVDGEELVIEEELAAPVDMEEDEFAANKNEKRSKIEVDESRLQNLTLGK